MNRMGLGITYWVGSYPLSEVVVGKRQGFTSLPSPAFKDSSDSRRNMPQLPASRVSIVKFSVFRTILVIVHYLSIVLIRFRC